VANRAAAYLYPCKTAPPRADNNKIKENMIRRVVVLLERFFSGDLCFHLRLFAERPSSPDGPANQRASWFAGWIWWWFCTDRSRLDARARPITAAHQ